MSDNSVAVYIRDSKNVKLSKFGRGVDSTYVSIEASCPKDCAFKSDGCYAMSGNTYFTVRRLDRHAKKKSAIAAAKDEAMAIDQSWNGGKIPEGQVLRLHVSGDCITDNAAKTVSDAVNRWLKRGGKSVWSYTHAWRKVKRKSWGKVNVLASIESVKDGMKAIERGYAPALVVSEFPKKDKAFISEGIRWIPCPAQTKDNTTCLDCKLCADTDKLAARNAGIAFEAHGFQKNKVKRHLTML